MQNQKKLRPLTLQRSTVRALSPAAMLSVQGGRGTETCPPPDTDLTGGGGSKVAGQCSGTGG